MSRYILASEAREDIKEICRYIARDNRTAAVGLRQLFLKTFRLLAAQPEMGEKREDLADNLRMFSAGNYVILFRSRPTGIDVVQVVHGARDLAALWRKAPRA